MPLPSDDPDEEFWTNPFGYFKYYRWVINFWFIGLPYLIFVLIANFYMLVFNIDFNYWWAGGNLYLMANTVYALVQSFLSLFFAFEIPVWLAHAKLIRMYSLMFASIWNLTFIVFWIKAKHCMEDAWEEDFDAVDLFEILFIGYNLAIHGPIFFIN